MRDSILMAFFRKQHNNSGYILHMTPLTYLLNGQVLQKGEKQMLEKGGLHSSPENILTTTQFVLPFPILDAYMLMPEPKTTF